MTTERSRRAGRRPGSPDTQADILAAAQAEFAAKGFAVTSVRGIARRAGVDPALVHHYFGSKDDLFLASLSVQVDPRVVLSEVVEGPLEGMGERLVAAFIGVWDDPESRAPLETLVRSAVSSEVGAEMLRNGVARMVMAELSPRVSGPDVDVRLNLLASHLIGLVLGRYIVRVEPLASTPPEVLVPLVGRALQAYLTP